MEWKGSNRHGCFERIMRSKLWKVILLLLLILIVTPLVAHYYLSKIGGDGNTPYSSRSILDHNEDLDRVRCSDMKDQIEELRRIKASVNNELRDLESKRQRLQREITTYNTQVEKFRMEQESLEKEVQKTKLSLDQIRVEQDEIANRFMPVLKAPEKIITSGDINEQMPLPVSPTYCQMHSCFDYSKCSLLSGFPIYVYKPEIFLTSIKLDEFIKSSVISALNTNPHLTTDPERACVFVVLLGEGLDITPHYLQKILHDLPYWSGDGRNHVLINMARTINNFDLFLSVNTGRALIAQSSFVEFLFRENFDIVLPPSLGKADGDVWQDLLPLSPLRRKYFLSFWGHFRDFSKVNSNAIVEKGDNSLSRRLLSISDTSTLQSVEFNIVETLKSFQSASKDEMDLRFSCDSGSGAGLKGEWLLCGYVQQRADILKQTTFSLIISPANYSTVSTTVFQTRLYESMKYGAVPVILGDFTKLPFSEILDWRRVAIILPKSRVTELHFYLRTFSDNDVMEMKRHGRMVYEAYVGTSKRIIATLLATLRTRLQIPAKPITDEPSPNVFSNVSFTPLKYDGPDPEPETDELLGPVEEPFQSIKFRQNFTHHIQIETFSHPADPFHLYPFTPFEKVLPSEAKFKGSGYGFRPINKGEGGSGKEFSEALGGNIPREQFTVVMLTYERETVLISAIQRLKNLPYLNKVVVVWNNPSPPSQELKWPDIGVPVHVVKMAKNSLNNRFLPFDAIETEAILSIDDDAHLRHDEIVFGFRVWREERDRVVGFPGRFHAWDVKHNSWLYNSNYSCELSMVLTGAAFFHKYYAYLYSYSMPQAIRDKVDEYMNCEDIAMNFLVSHITRKPPVKVTSRWTFRCPGCPQTLSNDSTHFEERHKCINFFVDVYGYMPLLYTQYRVDSVLFKTRISHDKQKCFKYI